MSLIDRPVFDCFPRSQPRARCPGVLLPGFRPSLFSGRPPRPCPPALGGPHAPLLVVGFFSLFLTVAMSLPVVAAGSCACGAAPHFSLLADPPSSVLTSRVDFLSAPAPSLFAFSVRPSPPASSAPLFRQLRTPSHLAHVRPAFPLVPARAPFVCCGSIRSQFPFCFCQSRAQFFAFVGLPASRDLVVSRMAARGFPRPAPPCHVFISWRAHFVSYARRFSLGPSTGSASCNVHSRSRAAAPRPICTHLIVCDVLSCHYVLCVGRVRSWFSTGAAIRLLVLFLGS